MKTCKLSDIIPLFNKALAGDNDAQAFFRDQWDEKEPCFFCNKPVGEGRNTTLFKDPRDRKMMLLLPVCHACDQLTPAEKKARHLRILRAVWPRQTLR